jgi:hypothetical protein
VDLEVRRNVLSSTYGGRNQEDAALGSLEIPTPIVTMRLCLLG